MNDSAGFWQKYKLIIILLAIIAILAVWTYYSGGDAQSGAPELTPMRAILLIVVGFIAGTLGGLIGTGGCSIMLPAIHFWMGYSAPLAIGTTIFAVIFTAISGGYGHLVRGNLDKKAVLWIGGAGIVGVIFGSWLFTQLVEHINLLELILGLAFLLPAIRMIWEGAGRAKPRQEGNTIPGNKSYWAVFGFLIGILTGIVGLGGGYALVPGLIYLFGAPVYITMGSSLAVMIPLAAVAGSIKLYQGFVALTTALILGAGTIVGAQLGAAVIKRFKPNTLKLIFGLYFLYVSVKFIAAYFGIAIW
ncbi:MAG: Sulfite exporter TauE/SafE [Methanosaeta sp. PtaB.Bin018]|jgi:hypothetical protein|nr:sulfite exporter TauE/SafE family protein [Methanothrix sp.]OPX75174.1 MAG: Sulfite exporter TauE/SafE [Methanosaeta sp. PtaB.Bin018]OPY47542.1 MAG: Sulfite exporter TauE/SafE [Methanosaeta sp. PtaU1.Bin016]